MKGPRGTLWKDFNYISVEFSPFGQEKKRLRIDKWWGNKKELATVGTISSNIQNMVQGSTLDLQDEVCICSLPYQRRYPGKWVSCGNLKFQTRLGITGSVSQVQKDELILEGNDN